MLDTFEIMGFWFLPGQDINKQGIPGTLKYSPHEIILELNGIFVEEGTEDGLSFGFVNETKASIFGFSSKGEYISMFKCMKIRESLSSPGYRTKTYSIDTLLIGNGYVKSLDDNVFRSCSFSTTYINAWATYPILIAETDPITRDVLYRVNNLKIKKNQKKISISCNKISLKETYSNKPKTNRDMLCADELITFKLNRFFVIKTWNRKKQNHNFLTQQAYTFRQLLTLLIGQPLHDTYFELSHPAIKRNGKIIKKELTCRLFSRQSGLFPDQTKKFSSKDIIIPRENIEKDLVNVINIWFEENEYFREITDPYIGDFYLPTYVDAQFLNIVRGLEAYHRFYFGISKYGKVISLRSKITDLLDFDSLPQTIMEKMFGKSSSKKEKDEKINKFITSVIDTRNYLTHRDSKNKNNLLEFLELFQATLKLELLLRYFIFTRLKINQDVIENQLVKHYIDET